MGPYVFPASMMEEALLYRRLDEGYVECQACLRECEIPPGETGSCSNRVNDEGILKEPFPNIIVVDTSGKLMDKPILHYTDPETKRTVGCCVPVVSVGGYRCNLDCVECPNPSMSHPDETAMQSGYMNPGEAIQKTKESGSRFLALTYNEAVPFPKTVAELTRRATEADIQTVLVTNTTFSKEFIDMFYDSGGRIARLDLKASPASGNQFYRDYCGLELREGGKVVTIDRVLDVIRYTRERGLHIELQSAIAPAGYPHANFANDEEVRETVEWIKENLGPDTPWHLTLLRPRTGETDESDEERVRWFQLMARGTGLSNVGYTYKMCDCREEHLFHPPGDDI